MESFEYLTSSDYLDTFSFVSSNTEEQDQFMQVIEDVNSASETSGTSLMGLMISNAGNSIQSLKSAIDAAQAKSHMSAEEEIARFQSTLNSSFPSALDEVGDSMSQQLDFDGDVTHSSSHHHVFYNDAEEIVEDRMNKLMKMMMMGNNSEPSMGADQVEQSGGGREKEENGDGGSSDGHRDNPGDSPRDEENNVDEHHKSGGDDDSGDGDNTNNNNDGNEDDNGQQQEEENEEQVEFDEEYMKDRAWKVLNNMKDEGDVTVGDKVSVEIKTRSDRPQQVIPDRLYSSLKYEFHQKVSLDLRMSDVSVMMCKMEIVDPKKPEEELLKANGEKLIRGVQDFMAITINKGNTLLEVKSKFQFTGVSYHHDKKFFAMKLSYYDPSFDMSAPVFSMISASFQVFARRPTARPSAGISRSSSSSSIADSIGDEEISMASDKRRRKTNRNGNDSSSSSGSSRRRSTGTRAKKRKSTSLTIDIPELEDEDKASRLLKKAKRQKTNANGEPDLRKIDQQEINGAIDATQDAAFTNFFNCLELLIGFKQNLRPEEQKLALEIAHAKLFPEEQSNNDQHSPLPQDLLSEHSHQESSMFFSS